MRQAIVFHAFKQNFVLLQNLFRLFMVRLAQLGAVMGVNREKFSNQGAIE